MNEIHQPGADEPASFCDVLGALAVAHPDRTAYHFLVDGEEQVEALSFATLDVRARALACRLGEVAAPGSNVLVVCPPGLDYVVALFACMHAGVVAVPAFPPQQLHRAADRLITIVGDARTQVAIGTNMVRELLDGSSSAHELAALRWLSADATQSDAADARLWRPQEREHPVALLQYTSGSTSAPRGVMLTHKNLISNCRDIAWRMRASAEHSIVSWLPPYHDMGLIGCLLTPALIGATATLMSPLSFLAKPARWLRAISNFGGHISGGPDFAYALCARRVTDEECHGLDLHSWRVAFNGAERVHASTIRAFAERFAPYGFASAAMRPCYGLAEATLCVSVSGEYRAPQPQRFDADALKQNLVREADAEGPDVELVGCGPPMPGHRVRIVETGTGRALPPGRVGEIWVSGPSVGAGIYRDPEGSRTAFGAELLLSDGHRYLRTGDLGFTHEGELFVVARLNDLIVIRGRNYYPDDIEKAVGQAHPELRVGATAAFLVEFAEEERLIIVQELRTPSGRDLEPIGRAIRESVARTLQLPIHAVVLTPPRTIPRTSSGKVQRQQTRALYLDGTLDGARLELRGSNAYPRATGTFAAAGDNLEARVQAAMARQLDRRTIQLDDDFFAMGGQSLLATRVISHLRETLGVDLPLRLIFDAPTPRSLASGVRSVQRHLSLPPMPRVDRRGPLPLSYSQERMLFMHMLQPTSAAYNIAGAVQLDGPLDPAAIDGAVQDLVARHEILRASYRFTADGARQVLREELHIEIDRIDFTAAGHAAHASDRAASELAVQPFDLEHDPLVRVALHRIGSDSFRLVFCVHHIVADGWSMDVTLQDFLALYAARRDGTQAGLPELTSQYIDYAAWQRAFLDSEHLGEQLRYWSQRLAGAPAVLPLPTDRPRTADPSHEGGLVEMALPAALVERLTSLGHEQGATLFMVMFAAFNVILSRYSGTADICVGTPIANRNWQASEGLIGTFVNTLVMRTDCAGDPAFLELIARVREVCLGAYDHQDLPFERLVDALQPERDLSHSPLFQVFFDFQTIRFPSSAAADLLVNPVAVRRRAAQFDLSVGFLDFGAGLMGSIEYRTDLFDRATIERMAGHFTRVLEAAAADPATPISRLPMLTAGEYDELVVVPNRTAADNDRFRYVHQVVGTVDPERVAVVQGDVALTYGALERRKNQLAHHLRALGVGAEVCVGVLLERTPELVVAMLATHQAGGAYIPMDPAYPSNRIRWMVEDGKPGVIVTERALVASLPPGDVPIVLLDDDADGIATHPESPPSPAQLGPEGLAYVIFTSGSTGRPKGVMVPHRALTNFLHAMADEPGCSGEDRLLSVTTVSFDIAALELLLPLTVGATVDLVDRETAIDAPGLLARLEATKPTMMQATPATWRMLIEAGWNGTPSLRVLCGGEALPRDLANALVEHGGEVWNLYGPTETTIWSSAHRVEMGAGPVPLGRPIRNTGLYILDGNRAPVPSGSIGELYIGGTGVARGYIGRRDLTDERFVANPFDPSGGGRMYRTGDAVRRG
ncbi:MAG: amino acid adenylation domain-containing protein, partial [Myxococcota bacterium]